MTDRPVRVRIGPSPTGEPHVGTAYIALFNLAFARKHGGRFVLRIEDTDQERSRPEWEQQIIDGLQWLGLDWDEGPDKGGDFGPYRQSERKEIYRDHVQQLVDSGHAYRCFCTRERLDAVRAEQRANKETPRYDRHCRDLSADEVQRRQDAGEPSVIRMKAPIDGKTIVADRLRGDVEFDNGQIDDQVIEKSDGFPTYHLANVVDDHLMEITHVVRAEEWISSTPKHVVLYDMFGWQAPEFFHMPLLRNKDRSKISKRKNPVSILDYKTRGFLPEAVLNYLAMLGWSMPDEREMFSFDEFVDAFTWDRMVLGGPVFDLEKLTWLNGKYFKEKLSPEDLGRFIREALFDDAFIAKLIPLARERIETAEEFIPLTEYFFSGDVTIDPKLLEPKKRTHKEQRVLMEKYAEQIDRQVDFSPEALEALTRGFCEAEEMKMRELSMLVRACVSGRKATPPLFDVMAILGRARVRRRLRAGIEQMKVLAKQASKK